MSVPSVTQNEQDGQLGVLPAGTRMLALFGPAPTGTLNVPGTYARTKDVIAAYTAGAMVHAACYAIENYGLPVMLCRSGETTVATESTIDVTAKTGTSAVTYDTDTQAWDDFDLQFEVVVGGTIGVTGITYKWSVDAGATPSAITALGTAVTFTFPNSGGVGFAFAAGTLVAGDIVRGRTFAPKPNGGEIATALGALRDSAVQWDLVMPCFDIDATLFDALDGPFGAAGSRLRKRAWIGGTRCPLNAESEATYLAALNTIFSVKATTRGVLCAGAADITSGADFRKYRRPITAAIAALAASVSEEIDLAQVDLGSLPGVSIRDANGNVKHHDEFINPGLDDARFCALRTFDSPEGVYPNNPRLFSATGSDFEFLQHRRVFNLMKIALDAYFVRRLSKPIFVSKKTGRILESVAVEIETGASAAVAAYLDPKPKASGGGLDGKYVKVSRSDNLLSTKTLTGQAGLVPLAYPKAIVLEDGFRNPANTIKAV